MVKKITSRFRALGLISLTGIVLLFERRALPDAYRVAGWVVLDLIIVAAALFGALQVSLATPASAFQMLSLSTLVLLLIATAVIFSFHGLYRSVIRYMGQQAVWSLVKVVSLSTLVLGALIFLTSAPVPKAVPVVYWLFLFFGVGGLRLVSRGLHQISDQSDVRSVIIYGAGDTGRQLLNALNHGSDYRVVAFVRQSGVTRHRDQWPSGSGS